MRKEQKIMAEIISRAWKDEKFKQRLMKDPQAVLKEYGLKVPSEIEIKIVENTNRTRYFIVPINPHANLSEEDITKMVAGSCGANQCGN